MWVSVTDAKAQLTELVRRAEAGDEIILTRHGHAAVKLVAVQAAISPSSRKAIIQRARKLGQESANIGASAAQSQDFLYGDEGMP
jgi:prevent-host-death family protein